MERNGQDPRPTLSVSQLNECIKATLESAPPLRDVYVQGELSGVRLYASGHLYFSLKDENSAIGGVMFARQVSTLRFSPAGVGVCGARAVPTGGGCAGAGRCRRPCRRL